MATSQENGDVPKVRFRWSNDSDANEDVPKIRFQWSNDSDEDESQVDQFKNNVTIGSGSDHDDGGIGLHPVRPYAQDCPFYMKTGTCKFGGTCKFNHPANRHNQVWKNKNKDTDSEDFSEKSRQTECKYYLTPGGCKYGESCRFNHSKAESEFSNPELNFLGLPIRLGEKECPFYMRTGSCGYGAHCMFHHPELTIGGSSVPNYSNPRDESAGDFDIEKWKSEAQAFQSSTVISYSSYPDNWCTYPNLHPQGYQVPNYFHEGSMYLPATPASNSSLVTADLAMQVGDFPQRPDQPDCEYFMRTGSCKFKSVCWYNHPRTLITTQLSDNGLPLRPGKKICWYYENSGFCKYGPACSFDHPVDLVPTFVDVFVDESLS